MGERRVLAWAGEVIWEQLDEAVGLHYEREAVGLMRTRKGEENVERSLTRVRCLTRLQTVCEQQDKR